MGRVQGRRGLLTAEGLALRRGGRALFAGLSLAAAPGEAVVLSGANGAGKTSLLRALAGLLRPAEGRVAWDGADVADDPAAHAARARWVGPGDGLTPSFTALEEAAFHARLTGGGDPRAALDAVGLAPLAATPVRALSTGQRRRLALARLALAPRALWLLDEPSLGLDAASVAALGPLFAAHRARGGVVVAATHLALPLPGARAVAL